jgi:beta-lactamase regulating signal transducer with metallopeptidase domain
MNFENPLMWIVGGLMLFLILVVILAPRFSAQARLERRRRKNNARIVSRSAKPTVKFSVHTKDKK